MSAGGRPTAVGPRRSVQIGVWPAPEEKPTQQVARSETAADQVARGRGGPDAEADREPARTAACTSGPDGESFQCNGRVSRQWCPGCPIGVGRLELDR